MQTVKVTALISGDNKAVNFISSDPSLKSPNTFVVTAGDEVIWELKHETGPLPNKVISIKFVAFPAGCKPLFKAGDTLTAQGTTIQGTVSADSAGGLYLYQLLLGQETLACLWSTPGHSQEPTVGAGGHRTPPPPN
jgi:hypothetical protein